MKVVLAHEALQQARAPVTHFADGAVSAVLAIPDCALGDEHVEQHVGLGLAPARDIGAGGVQRDTALFAGAQWLWDAIKVFLRVARTVGARLLALYYHI